MPGTFYVNDVLRELVFEELETFCTRGAQGGGFIPAVRKTYSTAVDARSLLHLTSVPPQQLKQIANVASLPGIVGSSMGMPDVHSGYLSLSSLP